MGVDGCIVAAEWIGAVGGGVGYYILVQENVGRYPYMFGGMIVIAILGLLTVTLSGYAEKMIRKRMGML
jgi:ABC-type nitrate/sulfonate/bicarbonate transport system permease component